MSTFQPADNLRSRTFVGLLIAQFLAAFNDQAIHASAMFFAINQQALNEAEAISLMPILFYAPWALFSTLAGYLADKYSKRHSLVFWKFAEVGITAIALLGFWMGCQDIPAGPWIVLSTVFLMGMHSAFFVPAKYGVMPEILESHMLSRGNGVLESLSFLAIILGTVCGGVLSFYYHGQEYVIGIVLVALAGIGSFASLLIDTMPAANPQRTFPPYVYGPLARNIRILLRSRPLALSVVGIAFFTFIVAFMRATVYMHGESQLERWSELKTSVVVGMVALGIGIGSPLVGFLSAGKVELGLIPIGALGMAVATVAAAFTLSWLPGLIVCIISLGFFTGFYIVPLFTLLQHRAPKFSKGDSIATSNVINVTGAILASLVFFGMDMGARGTSFAPRIRPQREDIFRGELMEDPQYRGGRPWRIVVGSRSFEASEEATEDPEEVITLGIDSDQMIDPFKDRLKKGDKVVVVPYKRGEKITHYRVRRQEDPRSPFYDKHRLPVLLFLSAAAMTLLTLLLLWLQLPSLFYRTRLWLRWRGRAKLEVYGANNLPDRGPVLLVVGNGNRETCLQVLSATDRTTRFLLPQVEPSGPLECDQDRAMKRALRDLRKGLVVGLSLPGALPMSAVPLSPAEWLFTNLTQEMSCSIVPVFTETRQLPGRIVPRVYIVVGEPLMPSAAADHVREALRKLGQEFDHHLATGSATQGSLAGAH